MDKPYTLTQSCWHKVADRLVREYTEVVSAVHSVLNVTNVTAWLGDARRPTCHTCEGSIPSRRNEFARVRWEGITALYYALPSGREPHFPTTMAAPGIVSRASSRFAELP